MIGKIIFGLLLVVPFYWFSHAFMKSMVKDNGWYKTVQFLAIFIIITGLAITGILKIISVFK